MLRLVDGGSSSLNINGTVTVKYDSESSGGHLLVNRVSINLLTHSSLRCIPGSHFMCHFNSC